MDNSGLFELAIEARQYAQADITGFKVGAALLTGSGKVYTGCNIEDPSGIGITNICAERCAIVKAISEGESYFEKIAVAGGREDLEFCAPCGACRQYLNSWCPDIRVIITDEKKTLTEMSVSNLLPYMFKLS